MTAYYTRRPDPSVREQRVAFGTSGHRGSAFHSAFNEAHILAITQAICLYRQQQGIDGPLFLGIDTHALSESAVASALEALAANGVEVMIDEGGGYTPTPVISHAILTYNRGRASGPAARRSGRHPRHRLDRGEGERVSGERPAGRENDSFREGSSRLHDTPARLPQCLH
jgi:alpha-D-glucose phosphate-specific phosphoglucomutase